MPGWIRIGDDLANLLDRDGKPAQIGDHPDGRQLIAGVAAIAGSVVDVRQGQQADSVVVTQCVDAQSGQLGELADGQQALIAHLHSVHPRATRRSMALPNARLRATTERQP